MSVSRRDLGLTQTEAAVLAGVSLATVQNIEAGRANPSVGTLGRILGALGMECRVCSLAADWDALAALGVPLLQTGQPSKPVRPSLLVPHLRLAMVELARPASGGTSGNTGRKLEAVQATLLALKHHFPTFYGRHFARAPVAEALWPRDCSGRLVKLSRLAKQALAEYL